MATKKVKKKKKKQAKKKAKKKAAPSKPKELQALNLYDLDQVHRDTEELIMRAEQAESEAEEAKKYAKELAAQTASLALALEKLDFDNVKDIANQLVVDRHKWRELKSLDSGNDAVDELDGILEQLFGH